MRFIKELYFTRRFFVALLSFVALFIFTMFVPVLLNVVKVMFMLLMVFTIADYIALFRLKSGLFARRDAPGRLANGSDNELFIYLENRYPFVVDLEVIDEIPHQFQKRDVSFKHHLKTGETKMMRYLLRPLKRGVYSFGNLNVFIATSFGLVRRRMQFSANKEVAVYPSFIQMRKYELLAISNRLTETGIKKIRRIGHSMEFEQIRNYVVGDDTRTVNWKATARRNELMVNSYQDERSQQVYCLIDKGRVMKMPFEGLSLLDYAINASLVLSNTALIKGDKAGLLTFANKISTLLPANRRSGQLNHIMELLYNQRTNYQETDHELLYTTIRRRIGQRSLLVLFTNFETLSGMRRQLPQLRKLAQHHLLAVVFFENTELKVMLDDRPKDLEEIYNKAVAEKFAYDKKLIVKELNAHGIHTILTAPQDLTVNTINKYLEFKSRGWI